MYLHLGQDTMINTRNLVGIFDLDTTSVSKRTRDTLAKAEKEGRVVNTSNELPKSFVVTGGAKASFFLSQLSSSTLKGRIEAAARRHKKAKPF